MATGACRIYQRVSEKLSFWRGLVKSGEGRKMKDDDGSKLKKDLQQFQCDVATNSEICHLGRMIGPPNLIFLHNSKVQPAFVSP